MITDDRLRSQEKLRKLKVGLGVKAVVRYNFGETHGLATKPPLHNSRSIQNLQKPYNKFQIIAISYLRTKCSPDIS
jgi:hypothetical protein